MPSAGRALSDPANGPKAFNNALGSSRKSRLSKTTNHSKMAPVVNQPKGGDPVSHCLQPRVIDKAWVIVPAKEFRA